MKKKIISLLLVLSAFLITSGVSAKEMSKDDIKPGTYMIGTHLFTRDTAGEYDGTLTVRYIMLAARTINSANIDDMIIYLKNSRGKWVNAVTNEEVTVPNKVDIYYQNANTLTEVQYGDVNGDGRVNTADTILIRQYLSGVVIPKDANILNGDVNDDGKITEADVILLDKYIVNSYPDKNLPNESLGKSYPIEYIVDSETYKVDYELNGKALRTGQKPKDPTKTGYTFVGWYLDSEYKTEYKFDVMPITEYTVLYAKFDKLQYGDVNCDGKVNFTDVTVISRYLAGYELPSNANILNGDVNDDGKITEADVVLLRKYLSGSYSDKNLPNESLGKSYSIEYIVDVESDKIGYNIDYELEGYKIVKPEDPTIKGYIFDGWYLESNDTKFQFNSTPIDENIILIAKFNKIPYGDVNGDGVVNYTDVTIISRYLVGYELPVDVNILNGDINDDGKITEADVVLLRKYLSNSYPNKDLATGTLGKSYIVEYNVDGTTYKIDYELEGKPLLKTQKPEDPIKDGYVFIDWYLDANYETKYEYGLKSITENTTLYARFVEENTPCLKMTDASEESENIKVEYLFLTDIYQRYTNIEISYQYAEQSDWELYSDTIETTEFFNIRYSKNKVPAHIKIRLYKVENGLNVYSNECIMDINLPWLSTAM